MKPQITQIKQIASPPGRQFSDGMVADYEIQQRMNRNGPAVFMRFARVILLVIISIDPILYMIFGKHP